MTRNRSDIIVHHPHRNWPTRVSWVEVLAVRHLHRDHGYSVRKINRTMGLTDREVRACLEERS